MKVNLSVTLDDRRDRDILDRLAEEENISAAVRQALRRYYAGGLTLEDIRRDILELEKRLASAPLSTHEPEPPDEPPDIADALDSLGRMVD